MITADACCMALRNFRARDGSLWVVWLVRSGSAGRVPGTPDAWLAFQNESGSERCRLLDIPDNWAELPDERLDLLRRSCVAAPRSTGRFSPPGGLDPIVGGEEPKKR